MSHVPTELFRRSASGLLDRITSTLIFKGATRDDIAFYGQLLAASIPANILQSPDNPLMVEVNGTPNSGKSTLHDMSTYQFFGIEDRQSFRGESITKGQYQAQTYEIAFYDRDIKEWQKQAPSRQLSRMDDIPAQRQHGGITFYQNNRDSFEFVGPVDVSILQMATKADPALKTFFQREEDGMPVTAFIQVHNKDIRDTDGFQFLNNLMHKEPEDLVSYLEAHFEAKGIPDVLMHWLEGKYPGMNREEMEHDFGVTPGPLEQSP